MQKPVASTTKKIFLIPRNSPLQPLGFSSFSQQNGAETDGLDQVIPSPQGREGYQNEDEVIPGPACHLRSLPQANSSSFSSPLQPQLQTSSYIGGNSFTSTIGSRERRWACKHLKLEPAGQPSFPPPSLQKPWSCRLRGDRHQSWRDKSHP